MQQTTLRNLLMEYPPRFQLINDAIARAKQTSLNSADLEGRTPLWVAIVRLEKDPRFYEIVKRLLEKGANPNLATKQCRPLYRAAEYGLNDAVTLLIQHGADVDEGGLDGHCPLYIAARGNLSKDPEKGDFRKAPERCNYLKVIQTLLANGANPNYPNKEGSTPLHAAFSQHHLVAMALLLKKGADPNILDKNGTIVVNYVFTYFRTSCIDERETRLYLEFLKCLFDPSNPIQPNPAKLSEHYITALHYAALLHRRRPPEDSPLLRTLFNANVDPNNIPWDSKDKITAAHAAVSYENPLLMEELVAFGAQIETRDTAYSETPLCYAARMGNPSVAEVLVHKGADINAPSKDGLTPLGSAVKSNDPKMVKLLMKLGADPNISDDSGCTPLHYIALSPSPLTPQHLEICDLLINGPVPYQLNASYRGAFPVIAVAINHLHPLLVKKLLDAGASPEPDFKVRKPGPRYDSSMTFKGSLLIIAVGIDLPLIIQYLLEAGANPNFYDGEATALYMAVQSKRDRCLECLLQHPATDPNIPNGHGLSPLLLACHMGQIATARILIAKGANPEAQFSDGSTPLHVAAEQNHLEIVQLLLEIGADPFQQRKDGRTPILLACAFGSLPMVKTMCEKIANQSEKDTALLFFTMIFSAHHSDLLNEMGQWLCLTDAASSPSAEKDLAASSSFFTKAGISSAEYDKIRKGDRLSIPKASLPILAPHPITWLGSLFSTESAEIYPIDSDTTPNCYFYFDPNLKEMCADFSRFENACKRFCRRERQHGIKTLTGNSLPKVNVKINDTIYTLPLRYEVKVDGDERIYCVELPKTDRNTLIVGLIYEKKSHSSNLSKFDSRTFQLCTPN